METFKLLRSSHVHFIRPHHGLLTLFTSSAIFFFVQSWIFLLFFRLLKSSVVVYGTFSLFCDDAFILFLIALYYYAVLSHYQLVSHLWKSNLHQSCHTNKVWLIDCGQKTSADYFVSYCRLFCTIIAAAALALIDESPVCPDSVCPPVKLLVLLLISNVQILQLWLLATMELRFKILSHPDCFCSTLDSVRHEHHKN